MEEVVLKRISSWGKFVGILMMIFGILSALSGLLAFVVGAIPGVIMTFMAFFIYKSAKNAEHYLRDEEDEAIYALLDYYGRYLLFSGIIMIIYLALFVISIIFMLFFGLATFSNLEDLY